MGNLNVKIDSGVIRCTFEDLDGHIFSQFRVNPTDIRIAERASEFQDFFKDFKKPEDTEGIFKANKEIEDKLSHVLGYDSSNEIFGEVSAITILPDGSLFVEHVVDKLMEAVQPAIEARQKAMQERADSYTSKYE